MAKKNRVGNFIKRALGYMISSIQNPSDWLVKFFRGIDIDDVDVNEESALTFSAVYSAVMCISQTIAMLPLNIMKRTTNGKEKAINHLLYNLIHLRPNPYMSKYAFIMFKYASLLLWGNAYFEITFDQFGKITGLYPLLPGKMKLKWENKELIYEYSSDNDGPIKYPEWKILHFIGFSLNGLEGISPISLHRESISSGVAAVKSGLKFFKNGMQSGYFIKHPEKLSDNALKHLKEAFKDNYGGLSNAHKPVILEENMSIETIGMSMEDAQYIEQKKFSIEEVARIYRIPLHKLCNLDRSTNNNIEQQAIDFVNDSILPWIVMSEETLNWKLFNEKERLKYYVKFDLRGLLRGTMKDRYMAYKMGREGGWLNVDEIRELEDMNYLEDGKGKIYLQPLNMIDVKKETISKQGGIDGQQN